MKKKKCSEQSSKTVNKGFTLIELLVVVLIIGILAAIALPQYKKATDVSKVKAMLPTIRAIYEAKMRCYLVKNKRCFNLDDMDIEVYYTDETCTNAGCTYATGDYSFSMNNSNEYVYYKYKNIVNINFYGKPTDYMGFSQIATCYQMNGKNDICLALGGEYIKEHPTYIGSNIYSIKF